MSEVMADYEHSAGSYASLQVRANALRVPVDFGPHMSPTQYFEALGEMADRMFRLMDAALEQMEGKAKPQ